MFEKLQTGEKIRDEHCQVAAIVGDYCSEITEPSADTMNETATHYTSILFIITHA